MKQNLIQKQLKKDKQKRPSFNSAVKEETHEYDLTSKAFYVSRQLLETKYTFSKKALVNYLHGKPIILQQKASEHPPTVLKGYMSPFDDELIEDMIEVMIELNVLKEEKILLHKKSTPRLFVTTQYDWNLFPKVIVNVKRKPKNKRSIFGNPNQVNSQCQKSKSKSKLSFFIKQKTFLPVNEEKRQQEMHLKNERQKQKEKEKRQKEEDQINFEKQNQKRQKQKQKNQDKQKVKKERQKQIYESQLSSFWIKQREKIEQFVCPKNEISILESSNIRKSIKQKDQADEKLVIQTAGHVLQMEMKQLKQKEEHMKNPIKPIVSWNFMKRTLEIESSQSQNVKKSNPKSKKFHENYQQSEKRSIIKKTNQEKIFQTQAKKYKCIQFLKNDKRLHQNYESQKNIPHLKQPNNLNKQIQTFKDLESCSESTEVTQTNSKLKNNHKQTNKEDQMRKDSIHKSNDVFAQNPQQSMFSSSYYCQNRRSTESIPKRQPKKLVKNDDRREQKNIFEPFSFKRKSTKENIEETITIAKRPLALNTQSFEDLCKVFKNSQKQPHKQFQISSIENPNFQDFQPDQETETMAIPKVSKPRNSFQDTRRVSYSQAPLKIQIEICGQIITTPETVRKNQKTQTKDLRSYAQIQGKVKRDSFAEQLINDYLRNK